MDQDPPAPAISHLERRKIQAPIAAALIREFAKVVGAEQALQVAAAAVQADAQAAGRSMAEQIGSSSLKELSRVVREVWAADGALELQFLQETEHALSFNVIRCRYAEFYKQSGMHELGFCLSCCRDASFAEGFNPHIRFTRTQTIMQDDPLCDFRFTLD